MNVKPDSSLKAVQVAICYDRNEMPDPVIVFNDGSAWRKYRENWHCVWPAPEAAERVHDTQVTLRLEALQPDDVLEFGGEIYRFLRIDSQSHYIFDCPLTFEAFFTPSELKELLDRGVIVRRNDKVISGWPVSETSKWANKGVWHVMPGPIQFVSSHPDDAKPFAQLKAERNAWKKETDSARKALDFQFKQRAHLQARLSELEAKLAATEGELRNEEKRADGWCKRATIAESQLKAWQDAASVQLVEDSDEIQIPCKTPSELVERMKHLYRWASTSDSELSELRVTIRNAVDKR